MHPSIRPFCAAYPRPGQGGSRLSKVGQTSLSPVESQGQMIYRACSGSTPWSPTSWMCPEDLQREAPRKHPDQMPEPPQLALFDSTLWAPYPVSKSESGENSFLILSESFSWARPQDTWTHFTSLGAAIHFQHGESNPPFSSRKPWT